MDFAKSALFKVKPDLFMSLIGAAVYEVLFVFFSYPNDDTETATFDSTCNACWL